MKVSYIWCAMLVLGPLTLEVRAGAFSENGRTSAPAPIVGNAAASTGNADRLHSMLSAKSRVQLTRKSGPPPRSGAATGNLTGGGLRGAGLTRQPASAGATIATHAAAATGIIAGGSALIRPHVSASGRLGGSAMGPAAHNATIDGARLHHKF